MKSDKPVRSQLSTFFHRQKNYLEPAALVSCTPLTISCIAVITAAKDFFSTYLVTPETEQIRTDRSVLLNLFTSFHRQKRDLLADLNHLTPRTIFCNVIHTTADGCSATYLLTVQTEKLWSDQPVRSHLSTSFHRKNQHHSLIDLVHPTFFTISRSAIPTAFEGFSVTHLLKVQTEQIRSEKSVRSHLVAPSLNRKCAICILNFFIASHKVISLYVSQRTGAMNPFLHSHTFFVFSSFSR